MGSQTTQQQQQATASPQYQQLLNNEMNISNANVGNQMSMNNNSASLINSILTGQYNGTAAGITPQQNQSMVNQSLRDIAPQFQTAGILNSGEAGQVATQTAALTSNANSQFNVQAQQNLINAGLGGASSWSQNAMSGNQMVGNQLAGLNKVTGSQTQFANPFTQAFAGISALGSLGSGIGSSLTGLSKLAGPTTPTTPTT